MVLLPKIERQAWQPFRDEIARLYITEDLKLERVMSTMHERHGLAASKAQYSRQLKTWGFTKNVPSTIWTPIARQLEKRKREGKESDVYVNGCLVSRKKVRKEISRHDRPVFVAVPPSAPVSEFYDICTPREKSWDMDELPRSAAALLRGSRVYDVPNTRNLPWIITLELVESQFIFYEQASLDSSISKCLDDSFIMAGDVNAVNDCKHPWMNHEETTYRLLASPHKHLLAKNAPIKPLCSPHIVSDIIDIPYSDIDAFAFEAIFQRSLFSSTRDRSLTELFSRLQPFTFGDRQGDLMRCLRAGSSFDHFDRLFRFFSLIVYLSSNSFVDLGYIDQFLEWLVRSGNDWMLGQLMEIRTPTIELFGGRLLFSAIHLGYSTILQTLIDHKINVNVRGGWRSSVYNFTPLQAAVDKRNVGLVRSLLMAGAEVNTPVRTYGGGCDGDALAMAVGGVNSAALVRVLLNYGADPNFTGTEEVTSDASVSPTTNRTALQTSVSYGSAEVIKMLLGARGDPNPYTPAHASPLQRAALRNNAVMVRILLEAGASPNPAVLEEHLKIEPLRLIPASRWSVSASEFRILSLTPIRVAEQNDNMEIVQLLLDSGADVNMCLLSNIKKPELRRDIMKAWMPRAALQYAVYNNNMYMLRKLIGAGAKLNRRCCELHDIHILQFAAREDRVDAVQLLLRMGANAEGLYMNVMTAWSALQSAARLGSLHLVQTLIQAGANANAPPAKAGGRTALQAAAETGNLYLVQILMRAGAKVDAPPASIGGRTALQAAAGSGDIELVNELLNHGADVNAPEVPVGGLTALQAAVSNGDADIVELLLSRGARPDVSAAAIDKYTILQCAILGRHNSMIHYLIERGAPIDAEAFGEAVRGGDFELVEILLRRGADPNAFTISGSAPLHKAAKRGHIRIVEALLRWGADVNSRTKTECASAALQCAVNVSSRALVSLLLDSGADVNNPAGVAGETALQTAITRRSVSLRRAECMRAAEAYLVIQDLLGRGADPNAPVSVRGLSALEAAFCRGMSPKLVDNDVIRLLISYNVDLNARPRCDDAEGGRTLYEGSPLQILAWEECTEYATVKEAVDAGAEVNCPATSFYGTALQGAVHLQRFEMVKLLVQAGADVNAPAYQSHGRTALQEAVSITNPDMEIVRYLFDLGADVNAPAAFRRGFTALQGAAIRGRLYIVQLLLEAGADADAPASQKYSRTALEGAAEWGRLDTVQLLLNALHYLSDEEMEERCESAAKLAARQGRHIIAKYLREHRKKSSWKHLRSER